MNIEKALRDYRKNKGKIETSEERCRYWQECLDTMTDDEIAKEFVDTQPDTYGMPKARNNNSPVEKEIVAHEVTREMVKQWIKDDQSRIRPVKQQVKQIEIALGSLTEEENYVIDCKCIDNWKWVQVEIGFNEKYRDENKITIERLKRIKIEALKKMKDVINI
ncbi:MAG: hypothetical protein J6D03_06615 [Clostridia bacterium]|nr:hypothetical protein [Clostridia bacterium]